MARNDVILLDPLIDKAVATYAGFAQDRDEAFELFCFEQLLKQYDLSFDELALGWTDGPEDGGIDGFYVFADDHLVSGDEFVFTNRKNANLTVEIFTVKHADRFKQDPINSLAASLAELLDLTKSEGDFKYPYREEVLKQRRCLMHAMRSLADRHPALSIRLYYCSRGDVDGVASNITARVTSIREEVSKFFGSCSVNFDLIGATELLLFYRKERDYSLQLKYTESYVSREGGNYLVLVTLSDYYRFISDDAGKLRRYLFESNVRDYLGPVQVNQNISDTLASRATYQEEDFWWLNNGVTILSTGVNVVGKELHIENVQVVNGLQTTETIYTHFSRHGELRDDRAVLVKILVAGDAKKQSRIIKATNYQNSVDLSSLRGLDKIQRDIEQHLLENNWFYDRRRNFYKNQGKPAHKIISMAYLASAIRAVALRDPAGSQRARSKSLRDERVYDQIFAKKRDLDVYLLSLEIVKAVELANLRDISGRSVPIALAHYIAFFWVAETLQSSIYTEQELLSLKGKVPTPDDVARIRGEMREASKRSWRTAKTYDGIVLNRDLMIGFIADKEWADTSEATAKLIQEADAAINVEPVAPTESAVLASIEALNSSIEPRVRIAKLFQTTLAALEMKDGISADGGNLGRRLYDAVFDRTGKNKRVRFLFVGIRRARSLHRDCDQSMAAGYAAAVCELIDSLGVLSSDGSASVRKLQASFRAEVEELRK